MEEHHTKHVTYKIAYHFVWCPKYRKQILVGEIAQFVEAELRRLCKENNWKIGALKVQEDHIHLSLSALPSSAPSLIANTSRASLLGKSLSGFLPSKSNSGAVPSGRESAMWERWET